MTNDENNSVAVPTLTASDLPSSGLTSSGTAITTGTIISTDTSTTWHSPNINSGENLDAPALKFNVADNTCEFTYREMFRLREMLTEFIRTKHPEDLL